MLDITIEVIQCERNKCNNEAEVDSETQELDFKQKMQIQNKIEGQKILLLFLE